MTETGHGRGLRREGGEEVDVSELREAKRALRRRLRATRDALRPEERSRIDEQIARRVLASDVFRACDTLLSYLSFGSEVATREIVEAALAGGKQVALPRCSGAHELSWHVVKGTSGLVPSRLGMEEPDPARCPELCVADSGRSLCIVPGLAFDRSCYRLGYGGGYYDSFLAGFRGITLGLCREELLVDDLDALGALEAHDLPVDLVLTERSSIGRGTRP